MARKGYRVESDSMGEMTVPSHVYYGAQTARAIENFPISGIRKHRLLVQAMGMIKLAAAESNMELGLLQKKLGRATVAYYRSEVPISLFTSKTPVIELNRHN